MSDAPTDRGIAEGEPTAFAADPEWVKRSRRHDEAAARVLASGLVHYEEAATHAYVASQAAGAPGTHPSVATTAAAVSQALTALAELELRRAAYLADAIVEREQGAEARARALEDIGDQQDESGG